MATLYHDSFNESWERVAHAVGILAHGYTGNVTRYQRYLRPIRAKTMLLLRQRRLVYDDVERINEYMKSHLCE
jgi:hypothetical protein